MRHIDCGDALLLAIMTRVTDKLSTPLVQHRTIVGTEQAGPATVFACMEPERIPLHSIIRKQVRSDGLVFWSWNVVDRWGWTLVSGTVYGPRSDAVEKARATIIACQQDTNRWGRKAS